MTKHISRNFAMVAESTRRGNGDKKGLNIPETCGNMTIAVALDFLYRQAEAMRKKNGKAMLLTVLQGEAGKRDPMKSRLIYYGLFGKKAQTNAKAFTDDQVERIFVWGQNMTNHELRKIDMAMAALCKAHGDADATIKNYRESECFDLAMQTAKNMQFLVIGRYDDGFVGINDDDSQAFINLGYVKFSSGKIPSISAFDRPAKDGLVEIEWKGEKAMDYPLNTEGSISLSTTRSYLKNFKDDGTHDWANLRMLTVKDTGAVFWVVNVGSYGVDELPPEFFASFSEESRELLASATRISFEYGLKDTDSKLVDEILNTGKTVPDATIAFTGMIEDDPEGGRWQVYEDERGKFITIRVIRGTFFTQRVLD